MFDFPAPGPQEEAFRAPEHTLPVEGGELRDFPEGEGILQEPGAPWLEMGGEVRSEGLFIQFCAACHGEDGTGRELTDDYYAPDLTGEEYLDYPDIDLYDLIVEGGLSMPDYREELGERDRWLVIRYLRRLQAEP
ncbi:MAG: hypothetical protein A2Z06_05080 [Candidatus Glassbacteria bacterium RBG_16_58_8]|uniref:Cytochrome c domain-containing protein n=1 Tax=Candidatus Glassbacteria bacterium RBG_16_58_8 TaxID=1817866 RepID=A0A1F5YBY1_9BACT|nr:MAG: hypothetical protein A2Z06_05080 [Candidatus Glassbacteria bacterium RBG_16_58_8]